MDKKYEKKLSFVIPCYYSEKTISRVVSDICREFPKESYDKEIVLVNDGSTDGTFDVIKGLAEENVEIVAVNLSRNFGQDAASMAGYNVCSGEYIITLDDDGQNPPGEAHKLIEAMDMGGYDVVFGKYHVKKQNWFKNFGSAVNDRMANIFINKPKDLALNSYFIINSFVRDEMIKYNGAYPYIWGLILRSTGNIGNVYLTHNVREIGESTYTFRKLFGLWLNGFTSFSVKPLRMATSLGTLIAFAGFLYSIFIMIRTMLYGDVTGWTSLMAAVLILAGIQMIMLGIMGEYIGRSYLNGNRAPQFVIRTVFRRDIDD